ncbi:MAG: hypothetical protein V1743_01980 [Nanoarchaeota archaeon]
MDSQSPKHDKDEGYVSDEEALLHRYTARAGDFKLNTAEPSLEARLAGLHIRISDPSGRLDIGKTNHARKEYILSHNLPPVLVRDDERYYRVLHFDKDGLLLVKYDDQLPQQLKSISDKETIPITVAAQYLDAEPTKIRELMADGLLHGTATVVNLYEINTILIERKVKGKGRAYLR